MPPSSPATAPPRSSLTSRIATFAPSAASARAAAAPSPDAPPVTTATAPLRSIPSLAFRPLSARRYPAARPDLKPIRILSRSAPSNKDRRTSAVAGPVPSWCLPRTPSKERNQDAAWPDLIRDQPDPFLGPHGRVHRRGLFRKPRPGRMGLGRSRVAGTGAARNRTPPTSAWSWRPPSTRCGASTARWRSSATRLMW